MKARLVVSLGIVAFLALFSPGGAKPLAAQVPEQWEVVAQIPTVTHAWNAVVNGDGSLVYVTGRAGAVVAYDTSTLEVVASTQLPVNTTGDSLSQSVLTPDVRFFITGDEHGDLYFLDPASLEILHRFDQMGLYARIAVTSDSKWVITDQPEPNGQHRSIIRFYDLSGGDPQFAGQLVLENAFTRVIAATPDNLQVYATIGARFGPTEKVYVIDIATRQHVDTIDTGDFSDLIMDPARNLAYLGGLDGLGVVDVGTASLQTIWPASGQAYSRLAYDPMNDLIAAVDHFVSTIDFISPSTGEIVGDIQLPGDYLAFPTFSPDGKRLYVPNFDPSGGTLFVVERANQPPLCDAAVANPDMLWPPNHEFVAISVLGVTDPDSDPATITIDSIFQDEPVDVPGSGNTSPDGQGVGTATAEVRAERVGSGNGRYYHISFTADDGNGGACSDEVLVGVPKSQGTNGAPVDDGALYDSTVVP